MTPESRRAQLLQVARALFLEHGFAGTSVAAIVRTAGVAQGTFYIYFPSKQALLAELRREVFRDYASTLANEAARCGPADERLCRVIVAMLPAVARNLDLERVFRHADSAEDSLRVAREGRSRLADTAARFIDEGVAQGLFHANAPHRTARFIITLFDSLLYEALVYEPEAANAVLDDSLRFVLQGVGVPSCRVAELLAASQEWRKRP